MRSSTKFSIFLTTFFLCAGLASAQQMTGEGGVDTGSPMGATPGVPFRSQGVENINPKTGNLNIAIPILNMKGAGKADTSLYIFYNSRSPQIAGNTETSVASPTILCSPHGTVTMPEPDPAFEYGEIIHPAAAIIGCDGSVYDGNSPGSEVEISNGYQRYQTIIRDGVSHTSHGNGLVYPDGMKYGDLDFSC